jgi:hypothetical protein
MAALPPFPESELCERFRRQGGAKTGSTGATVS